jgi:hypothetical protein
LLKTTHCNNKFICGYPTVFVDIKLLEEDLNFTLHVLYKTRV